MAMLAEALSNPAWFQVPAIPLAVGSIGLYLASLVATRAAIGPRGGAEATAGLIAFAQFIAASVVSFWALFSGRPDIALGITFATAVASVTLALGLTVFLAPREPLPESRRAWPYLLPVALLLFIAGFSGALNLIHGLMLLVLGTLVLGLWRSLGRFERDRPPAEAAPPAEGGSTETPTSIADTLEHAANPPEAVTRSRSSRRREPSRWAGWAFALVLATLGSYAAVLGIWRGEATSDTLRATLIAAGILGPLLVLPLLAVGTDLAQRGRSGQACSACVGLALFNLLLQLPLLIVANAARQMILAGGPGPAARSGGALAQLISLYHQVPSLPLPLALWRIDLVVITVAAMILLPVSQGRWRLGRAEGLLMVGSYAGYLTVTAFLSVGR